MESLTQFSPRRFGSVLIVGAFFLIRCSAPPRKIDNSSTTGTVTHEQFLQMLGVPAEPSQKQIDDAESGTAPPSEEIVKAVDATLRISHKDYDSARIDYHGPLVRQEFERQGRTPPPPSARRRFFVKDFNAKTSQTRYQPAWEVFVWVNAKNSYGGYTGFKTWAFYWVNGKCVHYDAPSP